MAGGLHWGPDAGPSGAYVTALQPMAGRAGDDAAKQIENPLCAYPHSFLFDGRLHQVVQGSDRIFGSLLWDVFALLGKIRHFTVPSAGEDTVAMLLVEPGS